jgi:hypothetical protein
MAGGGYILGRKTENRKGRYIYRGGGTAYMRGPVCEWRVRKQGRRVGIDLTVRRTGRMG